MKRRDTRSSNAHAGGSTLHRWITGTFGGVFVAAALALLIVADIGRPAAMVGFLLILGVGLDVVVAALRNRRSLIERIGPLP